MTSLKLYCFCLLIVSCIFSSCNSALKARKENFSHDTETMVGLACYYGGMPTRPVSLFEELVSANDTATIRKSLFNDNPAIQFLAICLCEYYEKEKGLVFTEKENEAIKKAYSSAQIVWVCSGCTYFDKMSLKALLENNDFRHYVLGRFKSIESYKQQH